MTVRNSLRKLAATLGVLVSLFAPAAATAWDGVPHGHITDLAVNQVRTPELRAFLKAHRDAVQSGAAFPDWGHGLKPHGEALHADYLDAAWADLQAPEVRAGGGYDDLLAHYLGAYAHVVEDRVLDATLKKHAKVVGEADRDDMENAMLGIAGADLLGWGYAPFVPDADLARVYARAGYFGETRLDAGNLQATMHRVMAQGGALERQLKLLSFLSVGYSRRTWPWGAANLATAPGGYDSNAQAVAAGWEAIWARAHGRPAPFFVFTLPADGGVLPSAEGLDGYGRITLVTAQRFDVRTLAPDMIRLIGPQGEAPVRVWPYIDIPGHDIDLAFQIEALTPWVAGGRYELEITPPSDAPGPLAEAAPLKISFQAPRKPQFQDRAAPSQSWAMGLFLFAIVGGLAGVLFGLVDMIALAAGWETRPRALEALNLGVKAVAVALFGLALWLLLTDGAAFITYLRHHH